MFLVRLRGMRVGSVHNCIYCSELYWQINNVIYRKAIQLPPTDIHRQEPAYI